MGQKTGERQMSEIKTLSLMKGKQHFCFRYQPGDEAHVLDASWIWSIGANSASTGLTPQSCLTNSVSI